MVDCEAELVRDLLRPEAYPEPRPGRVEFERTHISLVFLTDHQVWKVKRAVDLGFVDFSSADKRMHFCEEEVRLNQKMAADVYLGVVPVRLGAGGYSFTGDGEVVDHAVKMRRLSDADCARSLLRRDALTPDHLARLAERLSRFYAGAREIRERECASSFALNIEGNLATLESFAGHSIDRDRLDEVASAQRRDLRRLGGKFHERGEAGRFREGHGDLRLEHVYFPDSAPGDPVVIDAVEFNEGFRSGDVALDVAFFAMELEAAGRPDLEEYFLYRFARETNDYELYPLLDFYICYRALIRTKVACLLAADPTTPAGKARRKEQEAAQLLGLAYAHACGRPTQRLLIAVGGAVGTGKSTLAEALAKSLSLPVISSDRVRKYLARLAPTQRGGDAIYTAEHTRRTCEEIFHRADLVLGSGRGVILDATFSRRALRDLARQVAATHGAKFVFVEATCDAIALRARLQARAKGPSESDADVAVLDATWGRYEPPDELLPGEKITLDTSRAAEQLVTEVRRALTPPVRPTRAEHPQRPQ